MSKGKECYKEGGLLESHRKTRYEEHMVGEKKHAVHHGHEGERKHERHHKHEGEAKHARHLKHEMGMVGEKKCSHHLKHGGKVQEFAMGGVAKIRHQQSTPKGFPVKRAARSV
jgi:hypothetical protein